MNQNLEKIQKLVAVVVRKDYGGEGVNFVTKPEDPFQIGVSRYLSGHEVEAHQHRHISKENDANQEFLVVLEGEVEATFYDEGRVVGSAVLYAGDALLQVTGGHSFKMLQDSKIIEVKQGPYYGNGKEKEYIEK